MEWAVMQSLNLVVGWAVLHDALASKHYEGDSMSDDEMRNVLRVDEHTLTAGQPTEEQLRAVAAEGVEVVINLATISPRYSLPDEAGLVRSLGLEYVHLPVDWDNPLPADFEAFSSTIDASAGRHVFIHCAANFRVTAFYGLYAMRRLGWTEAQADALRAQIWQHHQYPIWERFVSDMKARIATEATAGQG